MNPQDLELKKKRIETTVKIVAVLVTGLAVSPFIFLAIKGLVGLIIAAVVGIIAVQLAPWFAEMVANWRLKLIKAEAARNPIETLQNDLADRQTALTNFAKAITDFATAIKNFSDKLNKFKTQWSASESTTFEEQLSKMNQLLQLRRKKYKDAETSLAQYEREVQKAEAIWNMGQEAEKMNKAAGMTDEDFLAKIKVDTALDSVTASMNRAFAELETSLLKESDEKKVMDLAGVKSPAQLEAHETQTEDSGTEQSPEKVRAKK